jgi:hypothetical protein
MMKNKRLILGIVTTLWPFIALLLYSILDSSIWNEPNPKPTVAWLWRVATILAWTGTIPMTLFLWTHLPQHRHSTLRIAAVGLTNVAFSALYYGILYVFFLTVAFSFNHIFI